jgi:hypothetical protein
VTGIYNRKEIQEKAESSGVKILPKSLMEDIEIVLSANAATPHHAGR